MRIGTDCDLGQVWCHCNPQGAGQPCITRRTDDQGELGINLNNNSSIAPSGRFGSSSTPLAGSPGIRAGYFVYDQGGNLYQTVDQSLYGYFGAGSITSDAADYIRANMATDALVTQNVLQGFISGDLFQLPAGPLSVAVGAEYRRDWQRSVTDEVTRPGLGTASFIAAYEGNIKAKEAFAEVGIPILRLMAPLSKRCLRSPSDRSGQPLPGMNRDCSSRWATMTGTTAVPAQRRKCDFTKIPGHFSWMASSTRAGLFAAG